MTYLTIYLVCGALLASYAIARSHAYGQSVHPLVVLWTVLIGPVVVVAWAIAAALVFLGTCEGEGDDDWT